MLFRSEVLSKLIPVLDVIGQAQKMIVDEKTLEGIFMIEKQVQNILTMYGATEIEALGKQFDPNFHNAITNVKTDDQEKVGTVVEVFQKGYMLEDKILRHSVVIVAV